MVRTTIGYGSDRAGTKTAHGEPLGKKLTEKLKSKLGLDPAQLFHVPQEVYDYYKKVQNKGSKLENDWNDMFKSYASKYPELASEIKRRFSNTLPTDAQILAAMPKYSKTDKPKATRQLSQEVALYS